MKAKLKKFFICGSERFEEGTEFTIIKGMEADASDIYNIPVGMCYLCELNGVVTYIPAKHLIITDWSNIDWEQVRIQAAIAAMQNLCGCERYWSYPEEDIAKYSVKQADALIEELKKERK